MAGNQRTGRSSAPGALSGGSLHAESPLCPAPGMTSPIAPVRAALQPHSTVGRIAAQRLPLRTATSSAAIDTAISGGVLLPMSSPTGPRSRAISPALRSKPASRSRRLA